MSDAAAERGTEGRGRERLLRWTGAAPTFVALLVAAHVAFGLVRLPFGAIHKRWTSIDELRRLGPGGYQFRLADEETRRTVAWLLEHVQPHDLVQFDGTSEGSMQLLTPLLFPALPVWEGRPRSTKLADRPVFAARAPWLTAAPGTRPVVVATRDQLRLVYR